MSQELVNYIRNHEYIYNFLRDDSSYYKYLYMDNRNIKYIKKLARKKYNLTYIDRLDNFSNKLNFVSALIDVLK